MEMADCVQRWSFAPAMMIATPRSLLDASDGQCEDRLHCGRAAINVQQLAVDAARLAGAEKNHGAADIGWLAEAPRWSPAALVAFHPTAERGSLLVVVLPV